MHNHERVCNINVPLNMGGQNDIEMQVSAHFNKSISCPERGLALFGSRSFKDPLALRFAFSFSCSSLRAARLAS